MPLFQPFFFFFLAPFDARPGPWLHLDRVQLMGPHPHQGPAIAGHTSKKKLAEIRKAMSVGLAIIAAEGHGGCFFLPPPLRGGLDGPLGARGWLTWRSPPKMAPLMVPFLKFI